MSSLTAARMSYAAALVGSVTYGIYVVLAGICIHFLLYRRREMRKNNQTKTWRQHITLAYTILMLVIGTIYFVAAAKWSEVEFVESTVNPALFATLLSSRLAILKDTTFSVNIWLADSLILYRLYIVWDHSLWIMIVPCLIYLASIATGIGLLVETAKPGGGFGQTGVTAFGVPCWSLSVALNVLITLLIAGRLWIHQRKIRNTLGRDRNEYSSIAAIFAESAALYSICGLLYIPMFARNIPLAYPFAALWGSVTSIAPNLIILRVALGIDVRANQTTGAPKKSPGIPLAFTRPLTVGEISTNPTYQSSQTVANSMVWNESKQDQHLSKR